MQYRFEEIYADSPADRARYDALAEQLCALGHRREDVRFFTAPGRTELGGNHTDHQNGKVLAASVDVDTVAAAAENGSDEIRLFSAGFPPCACSVRPEQNAGFPAQTTNALLAGMIALFAPGRTLRGLDICASSTVLPGSGLSSSASVEVLLAEIFNVFFSAKLSALELAKLGRRAENEFFGKPCGLLDQAACAFGGVTYMDFRDPAQPRVEKLSLEPERYGYALFLISCGADHADLTAEYAAIPGELRAVSACFGAKTLSEVGEADFYAALPRLRSRCPDRALLRTMHIYEENRRVDGMRAALLAGDFDRYLDLVRASGSSSWRLLQNISPAGSPSQPMALTLAVIEKLLDGRGACRVHGGGFAGTVQAYVPLGQTASFPAELSALLPTASAQRRAVRPVGTGEVLLPEKVR